MERIQKDGGPTGLPDLGPEQYLFEAFIIMRPVTVTTYGPAPRDWPVVDAFARATGIITEPWEMRCLIDMSEAYAACLAEGEASLCIPPSERKFDG